jgi:hypothetical protein
MNFEPEAIDFYTPAELSCLLQAASKDRAQTPAPVVALCGLGCACKAVRLSWEDVFHVEGHVEVSDQKQDPRTAAGDCLPSLDTMARAVS